GQSDDRTANQGTCPATARLPPALAEDHHQLERHSHLGTRPNPESEKRDRLSRNSGQKRMAHPQQNNTQLWRRTSARTANRSKSNSFPCCSNVAEKYIGRRIKY